MTKDEEKTFIGDAIMISFGIFVVSYFGMYLFGMVAFIVKELVG